MRQLKIATLAAAVALVFAHAAQAATIATTRSGSNVLPAVQGSPTLRSTTTAPASSGTAGTGSTTTTTSMQQAPTTTVDVRNQQTNAALVSTHAVGSTSSIASVLNSASANSTGTGTTSGTGSGTTSGLGATGTNGNVVLVPLTPVAGVPGVIVGNGAILNNPADFTGGNVIATGLGAPVYASAADVMGGSAVMDTTLVAGQATPNGASVDRAIREVSKDRRRIGRNGQLLYTIAPRTNVDRSHEMPDDPLPYSLTGTNSTLNR